MSLFVCVLLGIAFGLTGCGVVGDENIRLSVIYGVCLIISLLLLSGYCAFCKKIDKWFLWVFVSVLIVDLGYFGLSSSQNLQQALYANGISYLGSVFLPMAMLMIILNVANVSYKKWLPTVLFVLAFGVFLIAASPGYLPIYYKEVSFRVVNGAGTLMKVYGPLHILYLFYLIGYFVSMVVVIGYSFVKKTADTFVHSTIIAVAVFVNLGVWFLEQFTNFQFEFLAVSYIITELFLIGLTFLIREHQRLKEMVKVKELVSDFAQPQTITQIDSQSESSDIDLVAINCFVSGYQQLTKTERAVFSGYIHRMTTKEIMASLGITENTLKFHNKNLYGKLNVSSRKQLMSVYEQVKAVKGQFEE